MSELNFRVDPPDGIFCRLLSILYQYTSYGMATAINSQKNHVIHLAWELHILDDKKFIALSEKLLETGRMLGGWKKGLITKIPTR